MAAAEFFFRDGNRYDLLTSPPEFSVKVPPCLSQPPVLPQTYKPACSALRFTQVKSTKNALWQPDLRNVFFFQLKSCFSFEYIFCFLPFFALTLPRTSVDFFHSFIFSHSLSLSPLCVSALWHIPIAFFFLPPLNTFLLPGSKQYLPPKKTPKKLFLVFLFVSLKTHVYILGSFPPSIVSLLTLPGLPPFFLLSFLFFLLSFFVALAPLLFPLSVFPSVAE